MTATVRDAERHLRQAEREVDEAREAVPRAVERKRKAESALVRAQIAADYARTIAVACIYPGCDATAGQECNIPNRGEFMTHTIRNLTTPAQATTKGSQS